MVGGDGIPALGGSHAVRLAQRPAPLPTGEGGRIDSQDGDPQSLPRGVYFRYSNIPSFHYSRIPIFRSPHPNASTAPLESKSILIGYFPYALIVLTMAR
jgi:hypothetical protein